MDINNQELSYITELLNISTKMLSAFNLEKLLRQILNTSLDLLKADTGSLMLIEENSKTLKIKAARGINEDIVEKVNVEIGKQVSGWVAKEGKPLLLVGGLKNDPRFGNLDGKKEIKSSICVPLNVEGRTIGVLNVNNVSSQNLFSESDLKLLSLLANQAAISIWGIRLYEEAKKANEETRIMQKQLIEKEKMAALGLFTAGIAHEINNPLATIIGNTQYLMEHITAGAFGWDEIKDVRQAAELSSRIIARLFQYCRPSEGKKEAADINVVVEQIVELARKQFEKQSIRFNLNLKANLPNIVIVLDELREVFLNIIFNAQSVMPKGGVITIETKSIDGGSFVEVIFRDNGPGISEQIIDKIFTPFFSTRRPKSLGLGLAICQRIISSHNGIIKVNSKIGEGAEFIIRLPAAKGTV